MVTIKCKKFVKSDVFGKDVDKSGSSLGLGDDFKIDLLLFQDVLDDIKTDSKTPFVQIFSVVPIEYLLGIFYAYAIIFDSKNHLVVLLEVDFYFGVFVGVFDRVREGIVDDTLQFRLVYINRRMGRYLGY